MVLAHPTSPEEPVNWFRLHTELLWVHDGALAEEHRNRPFDGTLAAAWLLRRGQLTLTFGQERCQVKPGQWVFPPAGQGWASFSADTELLSVRFVASWPDRTPLFELPRCLLARSAAHPGMERSGAELARVARDSLGDLHTKMRAGRTTLGKHLHLQHLFLAWFRDYVEVMQQLGLQPQSPRVTDQRLHAALAYIEEHLSQPISESAIARHVSLSVSQLNRLFLRHLNMTPKALISQRRLQEAQQDLEFTRVPVKTIAYRLGFGSLPHFSRWFTQRTGQTPSAYRAHMAPGLPSSPAAPIPS